MVGSELENNGPHVRGGHSLVVEAGLEFRYTHIYLLSILVIVLRISQVKKARKKVPSKGKRMCRGPEASRMLVYLRNRKEASEAESMG